MAGAYGFAQQVPWYRSQYVKWFTLMKKGMEVGPLDYEIPATIAGCFYVFGLVDEGDKYLQHAFEVAPAQPSITMTKLYRFVVLGWSRFAVERGF